VSFDAPVNVRTAQISTYVIKNLKTGQEKRSITSPVLMTGLKNGTSYTFSVYAINSIGESDAAQTGSVIPQAAWKATVLDSAADGKSVTSTTFNNLPTVVYTDSKNGALKIALLSGKVWKKITVDGTGGTANITFNRDITTPLREAADFLLVKDAANRQGQGVSYDFSIHNSDLNKTIIITISI
jgi:hypothetical protein